MWFPLCRGIGGGGGGKEEGWGWSQVGWNRHQTLMITSSSAFPSTSLGFTILLLLLRSHLHLWGSPFFFFFCVPIYISGVHHSSSSSAFPATSLGFTILLLLLCSQLYLWASPFFFFFCVPSYTSGVHHFSELSVYVTVFLLIQPQRQPHSIFMDGMITESLLFSSVSQLEPVGWALNTNDLLTQLELWWSPCWCHFCTGEHSATGGNILSGGKPSLNQGV